jgi:exodeoxyribonuclease V alpha subunit
LEVRDHGAQGETVPTAHLLLGETTGAAAAYVAMTRGRDHNTAHLVAATLDEARSKWIEVFSRDRADLGPRHAATVAEEAIERYGPKAPDYATALQAAALREAALDRSKHHANDHPYAPAQQPSYGIGR